MELFGYEINNGEKKYFSVPVAELCHHAKEEMPVIAVIGKESGPVLWINGTVHGDELNGSWAAWELSKELDPNAMRGSLIVTPIANLNGFYDRNKVSILDNLDMDTQFPGDPNGMISQRLAACLYGEIRKNANALISFHTMGTPYTANPYSVRKIVPGVRSSVTDISEKMQKAFGVHANCVVDLGGKTNELPGVTNGALDITAMKDGIPAFMGEMGKGGCIDDTDVSMAKRGILNVMACLGILDREVETSKDQIKITNRKFFYADHGGMMKMIATPGDIVKKGEEIAYFHYYDDEHIPYVAAQDMYIIGARENPVMNEGDRVCFAGLKWENWT